MELAFIVGLLDKLAIYTIDNQMQYDGVVSEY